MIPRRYRKYGIGWNRIDEHQYMPRLSIFPNKYVKELHEKLGLSFDDMNISKIVFKYTRGASILYGPTDIDVVQVINRYDNFFIISDAYDYNQG